VQNYTSLSISSLLIFAACTTGPSKRYEEAVDHGVIVYPFAHHDQPIGINQPENKFVIRSVVGNTEYAIEIPGAAEQYDIELPLADLGPEGGIGQATSNLSSATTDLEFERNMPKLPASPDKALVQGAYGLGEVGGPKQSPSYTLALSRINQHYLKRQYEYALIEINNLLSFYPTSVQLYKMKGTILRKMRNFELAKDSWQRALDLDPNNQQIRAALERLAH
jgi:tetratricopeptide (TPR) repeat protein